MKYHITMSGTPTRQKKLKEILKTAEVRGAVTSFV